MKRARMWTRRLYTSGASMVEYVIVVGLIALLAIGALTTFREKVEAAFTAGGNKINADITTKLAPS